jgi:hypothetical protein
VVKKWKLVHTTLSITVSAKKRMYNEFLIQFTRNGKYLVGFNAPTEVGTYTVYLGSCPHEPENKKDKIVFEIVNIYFI